MPARSSYSTARARRAHLALHGSQSVVVHTGPLPEEFFAQVERALVAAGCPHLSGQSA